MKETGPKFLTRQGALESPPSADRYKPEILDEAAAELGDSVGWAPRSAGGSGNGSANGSGGNASAANASTGNGSTGNGSGGTR